MLGQLPNLEELNISHLNRLRCIGNEYYGNYDHPNNHKALFPKLNKFVLSQMPNLEQWEEIVFISKKGAIFPLLEDLNIRVCLKLTSIPNMFGWGSEDGIRSLKKLHIYGCDEVTKLPKRATTLHFH
ncbi:unnamed protein product [Citrullus colocynthis]|uniref:Uncharacterized protein n=1 Tax=Citrullus colocynthis TaxID=252529 RepID=A0ABP0YWK4_9ROSI